MSLGSKISTRQISETGPAYYAVAAVGMWKETTLLMDGLLSYRQLGTAFRRRRLSMIHIAFFSLAACCSYSVSVRCMLHPTYNPIPRWHVDSVSRSWKQPLKQRAYKRPIRTFRFYIDYVSAQHISASSSFAFLLFTSMQLSDKQPAAQRVEWVSRSSKNC